MKVIEIIESIDTFVPNSIPLKEKIKWLNQIQGQLYRDYPFKDGIMTFNVTAGESFYATPKDSTEQTSMALVVGNKELPYAVFYDDLFLNDTDEYWTVVQDSIYINPQPDTPTVAYFYYKKSPKELTIADLETVPDLPADFHDLYVLGGCLRAAKTSKETINLVSMYESEYLQLAEKADLVVAKRRQTKVSIPNPWM